jgi:hypothetical protein
LRPRLALLAAVPALLLRVGAAELRAQLVDALGIDLAVGPLEPLEHLRRQRRELLVGDRRRVSPGLPQNCSRSCAKRAGSPPPAKVLLHMLVRNSAQRSGLTVPSGS